MASIPESSGIWRGILIYAAPALAAIWFLFTAVLNGLNPPVSVNAFLVLSQLEHDLGLFALLAHLVSLPVSVWALSHSLFRRRLPARGLIPGLFYNALLLVLLSLLLVFTEDVVIEPIIWAI